MDKETLAKEYMKLAKEITDKEAELKKMGAELMATDFSKLVLWDKQLIKSVRRPVSLKKGFDEEVMQKFPEAVVKTDSLIQDFIPAIKEKMPEAFEIKTSIDIKVLEKNIDASEYLEIKETPYLQIRAYADENF